MNREHVLDNKQAEAMFKEVQKKSKGGNPSPYSFLNSSRYFDMNSCVNLSAPAWFM